MALTWYNARRFHHFRVIFERSTIEMSMKGYVQCSQLRWNSWRNSKHYNVILKSNKIMMILEFEIVIVKKL